MKNKFILLLIGFFATLGVVSAFPQDFKKDPVVKTEFNIDVLNVISIDAAIETVAPDVSPGYSWQDIENVTILNIEKNFEQPADKIATFKDEGIPAKGYIRHWQPGNFSVNTSLCLLLLNSADERPDIV